MTLQKLKKTLNWTGFEGREILLEDYYLYVDNIGSNDMSIQGKTYTPTKGDRIHFLPDCTVPRMKVKGYCDKYQISICKHIKDASAVFFGPESIDDLFDHRTSDYAIPIEKFREFLSLIYGVGDLHILRAQSKLAQIDADFIMCDSSVIDYLQGTESVPWGRFATALMKEEDFEDTFDHRHLKNFQSYQHLQAMLNPTSIFVEQDIILREINNIVMTQDMYTSVCSMFDSEDTSNHIIAMETMANCDYEKSCVYILLLMDKYKSQINNSKTRDHVNFKSLMKFFGMKSYDISSLDLDKLIMRLRDKGLLTTSNLKLLMPIATSNISTSIDSDVFEVTGIRLSKEYQDCVIDDVILEESDPEIEQAVDQLVPQTEDAHFNQI